MKQSPTKNIIVSYYDDDYGSRILMEDAFDRVEGWTLYVHESVMSYLQNMEAEKPDIVILDVSMPIMNGIALYERLRALYPKVRYVIHTGDLHEVALEEYKRLGFDGCIPKPCIVEEEVFLVLVQILGGTYDWSNVRN